MNINIFSSLKIKKTLLRILFILISSDQRIPRESVPFGIKLALDFAKIPPFLPLKKSHQNSIKTNDSSSHKNTRESHKNMNISYERSRFFSSSTWMFKVILWHNKNAISLDHISLFQLLFRSVNCIFKWKTRTLLCRNCHHLKKYFHSSCVFHYEPHARLH